MKVETRGVQLWLPWTRRRGCRLRARTETYGRVYEQRHGDGDELLVSSWTRTRAESEAHEGGYHGETERRMDR
jgi:hypothetical protein